MFAALLDTDDAPGVFVNTALPDGAAGSGFPGQLSLLNDGTWVTNLEGGNWVEPTLATIAALFEARVTVTSGSLSSGTANTWQALSTSRAWAAVSAVITVEIREAASQITRYTKAGITLEQVE